MSDDTINALRLIDEVGYADHVLIEYLPRKEGMQERIVDAMQYSCLAGGKRIRPVIMQEIYSIFGGEDEIIEPFMAAMEMIHTYSLVHDDLPCMDNDEYRRGQKTTWNVYGYDFGVLCGDALLTYAFEIVTDLFTKPCDALLVGRAINVLAKKSGISGMLGGQAEDVWLTGKPMNKEQLDFIYRLKTGALIEASMMIGAILAGADDEMVLLCESIAKKVGMAFQIRDDVLDMISSTDKLGKPVKSDEKNKKTTYVTLYGLEKAQSEVEHLMKEAEEMLVKLPGDTDFLRYVFRLLIDREN